MSDFKIMPCPICGSCNLEIQEINTKGLITYLVVCRDCGIHAEYGGDTKEEAIDLFNHSVTGE